MKICLSILHTIGVVDNSQGAVAAATHEAERRAEGEDTC